MLDVPDRQYDLLYLNMCCLIKIGLRKWNFFGVKEFFFQIWVQKLTSGLLNGILTFGLFISSNPGKCWNFALSRIFFPKWFFLNALFPKFCNFWGTLKVQRVSFFCIPTNKVWNKLYDNNEKSCSWFKKGSPLKSILDPMGLTSLTRQPGS